MNWSQQFREIVFLDSNNHYGEYKYYDLIVAVDGFTSIKSDFKNAFENLSNYHKATADWLFGYISYD